MIQKLKRRFILLSMGLLVAIFAVLLGGMDVLSYRALVADADRTVSFLAESGVGMMPHGGAPAGISPEALYESRYFSVEIDKTGTVLSSDTSRTVTVDGDSAAAYAKRALQKSGERGFVGDFRFLKSANGQTLKITFLDCSRVLDAFREFVSAGILVTLVGAAVVLVVFLFVAGRIVKPIADSYEKQKRFISDAGHEMKTPLTVIAANVELLRDDLGENEALNDISAECARLASLTQNLVTLSRMSETAAPTLSVDFPLSEVVTERAGAFRGAMAAKGLSYDVQVEPLLTAVGDASAIGEVVSILLDNALKYTKAEGKVTLTLEKHGKSSLLTVENETETPVPKEALPHLFDRFYRADTARTADGNGIGLSLAKAIVDRHKGKISAQADESRFRIRVLL